MQFSTLVPLCFCPATELVIGVPLPAPSFCTSVGHLCLSSRKIVFYCIIIIVIIIIVRNHSGSSPFDRCGKRRGLFVCLTAFTCETCLPRLLTCRLRGHASIQLQTLFIMADRGTCFSGMG